jgi:hypothetical protein
VIFCPPAPVRAAARKKRPEISGRFLTAMRVFYQLAGTSFPPPERVTVLPPSQEFALLELL